MTAPAASPSPGDGAPLRFVAPAPTFTEPPSTGGRLAVAAALFGTVGALWLPHHRAGLGMSILGLVLLAIVGVRARDRWAAGCLVAAGLLFLTPIFRDAAWVVAPSLVGALALAAIGLAGARGWRQIGAAGSRWLIGLVPATFVLWAEARRSASRSRLEAAGPAVRGVLIGIPLVLVFGALFASADAVFSDLITDTFDVQITTDLPRRLMIGLALAALAVALGRLAASTPTDASRPASAPLFGRTEWSIALGCVVAVFAAFVALQARSVLGGHDYVLHQTGLTYAQYARRGFAQLTIVATLTLAVLAVIAHRGPASDRLVRVLCGVLCLLTLGVVASAWVRLDLYEQAFGATRLRFATHAALIWFAATFALILVTAARHRGEHLPRRIVALTALLLLGVGWANPDRRIAATNSALAERVGTIDQAYLLSLSADAAPVIDGLPEPVRSCALGWAPDNDGSLASFNTARRTSAKLWRRKGAADGNVQRCWYKTVRMPRR